MADVFADLVANISINMAEFNKQLSNIRKSLGNVDNLNKKADSKALKTVDSEVKKIARSSNIVRGSVENLEGKLKSMGSTGKIAGKDVTVAIGGITGVAGKVIAAMGSVELAIKGTSAGVKILQGDFTGALEVAKSLPAGIGPVVSAIEELYNALSGVREEAERIANNKTTLVRAKDLVLEEEIRERKENNRLIKEEIKLNAERDIMLARQSGNENRAKFLEEALDAQLKRMDIEGEISAKSEELRRLGLDTFRVKYKTDENGNRIPAGVETQEGTIAAREERDLLNKEIKRLEMNLAAAQSTTVSADDVRRTLEAASGGRSINMSQEQLEETAKRSTKKLDETLIKQIKDELSVKKELQEAIEDRIVNVIREQKTLERILNKTSSNLDLQAKGTLAGFAKEESSKIDAVIKNNIQERSDAELDVIDMINDARQKAAEQEKKRQEELAKQRQQIEERLGDLKLSIQQKTLRAEGKEFEAQTLGLQNTLQKNLLNTLRIGGLEEAKLLFQNFRLDFAALKEEPQGGRADLRSRFEDTLGRLALGDRENTLAREAEKAAKRDEKRNKSLEELINANKDIRDILKKNPGIAFFN